MKRGVVLFLALATAMPAMAADDQEEGVYRSGVILVTAPADTESAAGTSYTIDRADFERTGARTLDQALASIPSINVRNGADGTPRLDVRGLRTRQIKLLVNGIPFNSADDGQFDPTLIPTFAISRITLQPGASSVLYGDGGMGAVLNVQTRAGFSGFHSGGNVEAGSDQYWHANAYAGYGDGDNDFFAAAGVRARDAFPMSGDFDASIPLSRENYQDDGRRNNSDYRRSNLIASYSRQLTEKLNVGVFISRLEGDYGKPPSVFDCQGNTSPCFTSGDPFAASTKYERTEGQHGTTVQLGGDYAFNANWTGRLWYFNNRLEQNQNGYDDSNYDTFINPKSYQEHDRVAIEGGHAQLNGLLETTGTGLGLSLDKRSEGFEADGVSCDNAKSNKNQTCSFSATLGTSNANNAKVKYSPLAVDKRIQVTSYAFELTQPLPEAFGLVVGVGHHVQDKPDGNSISANSAQLGLTKKLWEISTLYATVARKVDAPTISQLYEPAKQSNTNGNPDLKFERANHVEIGIKNQWPKAALDVAVYQSRVHGFIEKEDIDPSATTNQQYVNKDLYVFQGVDANGTIRPTDALTLRGALGLLRARDESANAATDTLQYRPHLKLTLDAEYRFLGNWVLSGNYQHVGAQAYFNKNDDADYRYLDSFDLVSTQLRYLLPRKMGSVYVGADNLLDEDYATSYGFPQAGRFVYTGLQLNW